MSFKEETSETFCGLPAKVDMYNGIYIDLFDLSHPTSTDEFRTVLDDALDQWIKVGRRCLWFRVPSTLSHLIPVFIENGFVFHHARTKFVMLIKWISANEKVMAPRYAHTTVGVGGLVYDPKKRKVLLIQEKNARVRIWKFPGGYAEPNEDLADTAIREVKEETGLECFFQSMLTFRHRHDGIFGCSDFYFVCLLCPTEQNQTVHQCEQEIEACRWFELEEAKQVLSGFNRFVFDKFFDQYSLGEEESASGEKLAKSSICSKVIDSKYGHIELKERVYSVEPTPPFQ